MNDPAEPAPPADAWPAECDLSKAAELFGQRGRKVDRSRLSRFVSERNFPSRKDGRSRLINPEALFKAFTEDFTRQNMAGELGLAPTMPAAAPQRAPATPHLADPAAPETPTRDDPTYRLKTMQADRLLADTQRTLGNLLPKDETAGMALAAMGNLRAALNEALSDAAENLITALDLPAHKHPVIVAGLKAYSQTAQTKFHATFTPLADDLPAGMAPNVYVEAVVAYAARLRETGVADDASTDTSQA